MKLKYDMHGSEPMTWLGMSKKSFGEICSMSNVKPEWKDWEFVIKEPIYQDNIFKPINMYVHHFGILPDIEELPENKLLLKYYNYSDIYLYNKKYIFYATEKSWLRQFYPGSKIDKDIPDNLISFRPYKFFLPWIVDSEIKYTVPSNTYNEAIYIPEQEGRFSTSIQNNVKDAVFINFYFKDFLNNNAYCIIKRGTHIFSIIIEASNLKDRIIDERNKIYSDRK
jgi:hypothetical protein